METNNNMRPIFSIHMKAFYIGLSFLILSLAGCKQNSSEKLKEEAHQDAHEESTEILLSDAQMKAVNIQIGKIEQMDLGSMIRVNGEMALDPQDRASITSLVGGRVKQILVIDGARVNKDQTVAYIENTEIVELQKKYLRTEKEALIAEQEYRRQKELSKEGAGVEKMLQQASANYEISKAEMVGLEKQLQQLSIKPRQVSAGNLVTQIPLKSPISGNVDKVFVRLGSYVDMQNILMNISDNAETHCDLKVFEKDISKLKIGQDVDITLTNQPGIILKGTIFEIRRSFDNETKTILVHTHIKDKKGLTLFPGMYVSSLINVGKERVNVLPNEAIISSKGKKYIFIYDGKKANSGHEENTKESEMTNRFQQLEVITGKSELGYTQITPINDLAEDAQIVKSGAFYIASQASDHGDH